MERGKPTVSRPTSSGQAGRRPDIRVPGWLACRREISNGAKLYYAVLKWHARKKDRAWPSRKRIGEWLGCGQSTVGRYQSELTKHRLIKIRRRFKGSTICFFAENHPWFMRSKMSYYSVAQKRATEFFLTKKQQNAAAATLYWHHKTFGTAQ
jgi:hypothetical protein